MHSDRFFDRDLSWLSFNGRVLQEARDPSVPLYERLRFLAIYSSNLDEFFRVRVAGIRSLLRLGKGGRRALDIPPEKLLRRIHAVVDRQQSELGLLFRTEIMREIAERGVCLVDESMLSEEERQEAMEYFRASVASLVEPVMIEAPDNARPFLHNRGLYLAVAFDDHDPAAPLCALVPIPADILSRFVLLRASEGRHPVILLDDVIRLALPELFPGRTIAGSWAIKLTRDAELYIDDEFSGDLLVKIRKALHKRNLGVPSRFLFDMHMPRPLLDLLRQRLELAREDLVPGGRYHNLSDFMAFPNPGIDGVEYEPMPPLEHRAFADGEPIFTSVARRDIMIHLPYHSYDPVIRFIADAAADPLVRSIRITLYRVASNSRIVGALVDALRNGKEVTAFLEVKARFDEESNFYWAGELERAGARVLYSMPGMKVHSKICLVERDEERGRVHYAYLGTGNFNEKTARFYGDHGLFTADIRLTSEVSRLFAFLEGRLDRPEFEHLLVAPFNMRDCFVEAIDTEIAAAKRKEPAEMILKMNSLEDPEMIRKLYEAADAGVKITIIVRGICSLMAGRKNIRITSIVDRYLEHARIYIFHNGGAERTIVASADWMTRNLSRRIEVGFPIYDAAIARELRAIIDLQIADNTKSRVIGKRQINKYRKAKGEGVRAQVETYERLKGEE